MNYAPLVALWPTLSGSADEKLATINAMTVACNVDVPARSVRAVLMALGKWPLVLVAAESSTHDATWAAARLLYDFVAEGGSFGTSAAPMRAAIAGELGALVAGNVITNQDETEVLNLISGTQSWLAANGFVAPLNLNDVAEAGLS
jgi:hypothetical protein